jgi:1-deoxy-D-xylulose-5-phosphate reductoisomerase
MMNSNLEPSPLEAISPKRISILGATGTIGQNTIEIIKQHRNKFKVIAITARTSVKKLIKSALELEAELAVIEDESLYYELKEGLSGTKTKVTTGKAATIEAASLSADIVVSGIVGLAALEPTFAAIRQGTDIALANKECLVCAGNIMTNEALKFGSKLLPVDSEHNAIFQAFDFDKPEKVSKITLTASGGPFYDTPFAELKNVTPAQAIKHPNWEMGAKISVDSATMMNKGLEVIEAYYLFPIEKNQIDILIHPESIIHCLVQYIDGAVIAGLSVPDMKVPIAHALAWPERIITKTAALDLSKIGNLSFHTPDENKFSALRLARESLKKEGSAPIIFNAANEVAVDNFLNNRIGFLDIVKLVENALERMPDSSPDSLEEILSVDKDTRVLCNNLISKF